MVGNKTRDHMNNIAVILAGGSGARFGTNVPKQFVKLAGKAVIEYTIQVFEDCPHIDEIIIVANQEYIDKTWDIIKTNDWKKVTKVLAGGDTRFSSAYSALKALVAYEPMTKVLFHDAVRPLVTKKIIEECIIKLDTFEAVDIVIPSDDTLVEIYDDGCIANIPNRSSMRRGQTPQGFILKAIAHAYELALQQKRTVFTCDCSVMRAMCPQIRVATVAGSERNIKITQPIDLFIAEKYLQTNHDETINYRHDLTDLKDKVIVIFGGSSGIGKAIYELGLIHGARIHIASRKYNKVNIIEKKDSELFLKNVFTQEGTIDVVVNTVGLLIKKPIQSLTTKEIMALINTNYIGAIHIALAAKPYLQKSQGMLLNFTSSSYSRGRAYYAVYSSTKSAIVNLTQALAEEWSSFGIRVNCMNPERTNTPMRTANFGLEDPTSLLSADEVAKRSLEIILSTQTG